MYKYLLRAAVTTFCVFHFAALFGQRPNPEILTKDSTGIWIPPPGCSTFYVELWGGGSGGSDSWGGSGGSYSKSTTFVVNATTSISGYSYTVGRGGGAGADGTDSKFEACWAYRGLANHATKQKYVDAALIAASYFGGYGGASYLDAFNRYGGGGAGSAFTNADGNNGTNGAPFTFGSGGSGGGNGGNANGGNGSAPGGGGAGNNGSGARGEIRITWACGNYSPGQIGTSHTISYLAELPRRDTIKSIEDPTGFGFTYSWEISFDGTNFAPLASTGEKYYILPDTLRETSYYRRRINGCDPGKNFSNAVKITVICPQILNNTTLINNPHTIPYPTELSADSIKVNGTLPTGNGLNYAWQVALNGSTTFVGAFGSTNPNNGFSITQWVNDYFGGPNNNRYDSMKFRLRQLNICTGGFTYSNIVPIKVFDAFNVLNGQPSKNGLIKGYVRSKNGLGVAGITVKAVKQMSLKGSSLTHTYLTTTLSDGSYIFNDLFYGDKNNGDPNSINFTITPEKINHIFDPSNRTNVSLSFSQSSYPQDINFTDTTVLAVSGKIYQQCQGCLDAANIPVNTVQAGIDSAAMLTGGDVPVYSDSTTGAYATTVNNPSIYTFRPSYKNHKFNPPNSDTTVSRRLNVQNNISNLNFLDTTTFTISGKVTDGCGNYTGKAFLLFADNDTLRNSGTNNRTFSFRKRDTTRTAPGQEGTFSVRLPAGRTYRVTVENFENIPGVGTTDATFVLPSDFANFFNSRVSKDSVTRNIDTANATLNLVYRRAPVLQIVDLKDTICGGSNLGFTVFKQNVPKQFTIKVFEGSPNLPGLGVSSGGCLVTTNDIVPRKDSLAISDSVRILTDVTDFSGTAAPDKYFYRLTGGARNISLTPGVPNTVSPYKKKFEVFYTDKYGREAASIDRSVVVTGIQSPPQTFVTTSPEVPLMILHRPPGDLSYSFWDQTESIKSALRMSVANKTAVSGNVEVKVGASFATGIGVEIKTEITASQNTEFKTTTTTTTGNESILTTSTNTKYTTKAGGILGAAGDVYIGGAFNFKYGVSNKVELNSSCQLFLDSMLIVAPDSLKTLYTYSEDHILNTIIPTLEFFVRNVPEEVKKQNYRNQMNVWQQVIDNNIKNKKDAKFVENKSFDGNIGGAEINKTLIQESANSVSFDLEIGGETARKIGAEVNGIGIEGGVTVAFTMTTGRTGTETISTSTTTGYRLADKNAGDYYSVNIKTDPVYGTPCFDLVAGTSSCPPEPGTQSRDNPQIIIPTPVRNNIDNPLDTVLFRINVVNKSESREKRDYLLNANIGSGFIGLSVGGNPLGSANTIPITNLNYLESKEILVVAKRIDPSKFSFADMELSLSDNCGGSVRSVNYITANFKSPCGNISMNNPTEDWVINSANNNSLPVSFSDYTQPNIAQVTVEYAKKGSSIWNSVNSIFGSLITGPSTTLPWNVSTLTDSLYKVRLRLDCTGGTVIYTPSVNGTIDRNTPYLIGKPQPSDNIYTDGKEISFTYNENINSNIITSANVQIISLANNSVLNSSVNGFGNKILITLLDNIAAFNGDSVMVIVKNIADLYGNVKTTPDTSFFRIGSASAANNTGSAIATVFATPASITSNSTGKIELHFRLREKATKITRIYLNLSGNASLNKDYSISYDTIQQKRCSNLDCSIFSNFPVLNQFEGIQNYVNIDVNKTEAIIYISPIPNFENTGDKTISIKLVSGGDYTLQDSVLATGTILFTGPPCPPSNILYVNAAATGNNTGVSWQHAMRSLKEALNRTCPGVTQIWVAKGTYKPTTNTSRDSAFTMKNNLAIYGGFAGTETALSQRNLRNNPTVLSGDIGVANSVSDNSYNVVRNMSNSLNSTAILDGFVVTGGYGNGPGFGSYGAGVINVNSTPAFFNCSIIGNSAAAYGGGMYNNGTAPAVVNSVFAGNTALYGGGLYNESAATRLINCSFSGNVAFAEGGAVSTYGAVTPVITNSILWGNSSGIRNAGGSTPNVTYSIVQGSYAGTGNLNADPQFVLQPAAGLGTSADLRLIGCSPAVNGGINAAISGVLTDLNSQPRITGTAVDMGAYERQSSASNVIYVDSSAKGNNSGDSWLNAYTSLGSALTELNTCTPGTTIQIAKGTYIMPPNDTAYNFNKLNAVILGGYPSGGGVTMNPNENRVVLKGAIKVFSDMRIDGIYLQKLQNPSGKLNLIQQTLK